MPEYLPLDAIRTDGGNLGRVDIDLERVSEYAEIERAVADDSFEESPLPPIVVFHDGHDYWLGDGMHRMSARRLNDHLDVLADVRPGTRRDAVLFAIGPANGAHGLNRSNADKRHCAEVALRDPEWAELSNRELARLLCLSHTYIANVRADLTGRREDPFAGPPADDEPATREREPAPAKGEGDTPALALQDRGEPPSDAYAGDDAPAVAQEAGPLPTMREAITACYDDLFGAPTNEAEEDAREAYVAFSVEAARRAAAPLTEALALAREALHQWNGRVLSAKGEIPYVADAGPLLGRIEAALATVPPVGGEEE